MWSTKNLAVLLGTAALVLVAAACGSSSSSSNGGGSTTSSALSSGGYKSPLNEPLTGGKKGGTLLVLQEADFEHLDPGISYYSIDYPIVFATQRPLYSNKPNTQTEASPDMAAGPPEISSDSKTVTVKLKEGVRFSPPVNTEVTAEDVAYAIQRGANPNVANPYFALYYSSIEGAKTATGGPLKGIETPNKHEIVFHLSEPKGSFLAASLVMPLSAAVPKSYAEKFDKNKPSNYAAYEVATGPYMIKNNSEGKVLDVGYFPGKSLTLVRNPNWSASSDFRPAYLNEVQVKIGGANTVNDRQVLAGTNVVASEPAVQAAVKEAVESHKEQLEISPAAGTHYIGVNNRVGPFKNEDLRKAFWAALNRVALIKARGGKVIGDVMTHWIYPGIPGFEQAGGLKGPAGVDYNEHPEGDVALAEEYIKKAGYPSGKYTGGETITVVGAKGSPQEQDSEIVNQTLKNLGFTTKFSLPEVPTMYAKYCNVPKEEVTVCPAVGWIADFSDPQTVLNITFNGKNVVSTGNVNWSQSNNPKINEEMTKGELVAGKQARASAWAKIDEEIVKHALAVPIIFDKEGWLAGSGVAGVGMLWDTGAWDYSFTSLK